MENIMTIPAQSGSRKRSYGNPEKPGSSEEKGLRELFIDELREMYWSEKAIPKALHKMIKHSSDNELTFVLTTHQQLTTEHTTRLEKVFSVINKKAEGEKCKAMEGLIKESERMMEETKKGIVKDAAIISAALKVEHYEIATYGTLCFYAKVLGENDVAALLHETLNQEKEANENLSRLIESIKAKIADANEINGNKVSTWKKTK